MFEVLFFFGVPLLLIMLFAWVGFPESQAMLSDYKTMATMMAADPIILLKVLAVLALTVVLFLLLAALHGLRIRKE